MSEDGKEPIVSPRGSLHYKSLVIRPTTRFSGAQVVGASSSVKDYSSDAEEEEDNNKVLGSENIVKLRLLAHGASAPVWLALHAPSLTVIALKTMDVSDKAKRDQLIRELLQLDSTESPFIVSFYGAFYDSGTTKLALEYMNRGSLQGILDKYASLKEPVLANVTRQILFALKHLHDHRKIHRDIKPGNILINHKSEAKLSDFGILAELDPNDESCNTFVGTTIYMSPERIKDSSYSYPADIWSLGLVILTALTGSFPFKKDSYWNILNQLTEHPSPTLGSQFSAEARSFVDSCLQKDPKMRGTATELLEHKWIQSAPQGYEVLPFWPPPMRMFDPSAPADMDAVVKVKQKRREKSKKTKSRTKDKSKRKKERDKEKERGDAKGKISPPSLVLPARAKITSPTAGPMIEKLPTTTNSSAISSSSSGSFSTGSFSSGSFASSISSSGNSNGFGMPTGSPMVPLKLQLDDIEVTPATTQPIATEDGDENEADADVQGDNGEEDNAENGDEAGDSVGGLNLNLALSSSTNKAHNRRTITLTLEDEGQSLSIESPNASSIQITPYDEEQAEEEESESTSKIMTAAALANKLAKRKTMLEKDELSGQMSETLNKVLNVLIYRFQHPELEMDPDLPPEGSMLTSSGSFSGISDGLGPSDGPGGAEESPDPTDNTDLNAKGPPATDGVHTNPVAFSDSLSVRFLNMRGRASFFGGARPSSTGEGLGLSFAPGLPGYRDSFRGSFAGPGGLLGAAGLTNSGGGLNSPVPAPTIAAVTAGVGPAPTVTGTRRERTASRGSVAHDPPSPDHKPAPKVLHHRTALLSMNIRELRAQTSKQLQEEKERVMQLSKGELGPGLAMALGINSPPSSTSSIETRHINSGSNTPTARSSTPTAKSSTPTAAKSSTPTGKPSTPTAKTGTPTNVFKVSTPIATPTTAKASTPTGVGVLNIPPPHPVAHVPGHPPVHPGHPPVHPPAHPPLHPAVSVTVPATPPMGPSSVPNSPAFAPMASPSLTASRPQTQDSFSLMKKRLESVALQLGFPLERVVRDFNELLMRSTDSLTSSSASSSSQSFGF